MTKATHDSYESTDESALSHETPLKVLIAEDHELSRNGIIVALRKKSRMNIVGEVENGREAVRLANLYSPDVVLMDIGMPIMDGIEATQLIKRDLPQTKIIMLTSHQD